MKQFDPKCLTQQQIDLLSVFNPDSRDGKSIIAMECYQIAQACEFGYEAAKAIKEKFGLEI